jgi:hypothetical protein
VKWEEREHPRNPDGTFRDRAGADWAERAIGRFNLPIGTEPSRAGFMTDEEHEENYGAIYDQTELDPDDGDAPQLLQLGDDNSYQIAVPHEDGWHVLVALDEDDAGQLGRSLDYVQSIPKSRLDTAGAYRKDEYGFTVSVRDGGLVVGRRPDGAYGIVQEGTLGHTLVEMDEEQSMRLYRALP